MGATSTEPIFVQVFCVLCLVICYRDKYFPSLCVSCSRISNVHVHGLWLILGVPKT